MSELARYRLAMRRAVIALFVLLTAGVFASSAQASGSLLSGYSGPGGGDQAVLSGGLVGGGGGGGKGGGGGGSSSGGGGTQAPLQQPTQAAPAPAASAPPTTNVSPRPPRGHRSSSSPSRSHSRRGSQTQSRPTAARPPAVEAPASAIADAQSAAYARGSDSSGFPLGASGILLILGALALTALSAAGTRQLRGPDAVPE